MVAGFAGKVPRHRFKLLAAALRRANPAEVFCFARSFTKDFQNVLLPEAVNGTVSLLDLLMGVVKSLPSELSAADQAMRMDAFCTLHDDYLQKVDVASMAFSLESRGPFLDHKLVEWSMRLPLKWKLHSSSTKYLLRQLAYRYVPREILDRPKHGFEVPLADWLRGPLYGWAKEHLQDKDNFQRIPLNQKQLIQLLELHRSGQRNVHPLLWAALVLLQFSATSSSRYQKGAVPILQTQATAGVF
jgi:asparagine synthase (glutamine-hydrolysing)